MPVQKATNTIGRRKEANARVYLQALEGDQAAQVTVNQKTLEQYFPQKIKQAQILRPLEITERLDKYSVVVNVKGGGFSGQAGAVVHGIARALQTIEPELRAVLKKAGLLTRDPRVVERKKAGRHKARKRPQFSKR
jgi:small subunit ribosomal protein S9